MRFSFLRNRIRAMANLLGLASAAAFFSMFFSLTLYMQNVLHYSALQAGLAYLPAGVALGLGIVISTRLSERFGVRAAAVLGLLVAGCGQLMLSALPMAGSYWNDLLPGVIVIGIGNGLHFPTLKIGAVQDVSEDDVGLASGLQITGQQVGGALGLAVLVALASSRTGSLLADGYPAAQAPTSGFTLAFTIAGLLLIGAAAIAAVGFRGARIKDPSGVELGAQLDQESGDPNVSGAGDAANASTQSVGSRPLGVSELN